MGIPQTPPPLTYTDAVCVDDVDPLGSETTSDLQNLEQDVRHILMEILGSNPDDINRGIGVEAMLSGSATPLQSLPAIIDSQLKKDARITGSQSTLATNADDSFTLNIVVSVAGAVVGMAFNFNSAGGLLP